VLVEMDGCRVLTDPVLVQRVLHLRRYSAPASAIDPVDAVLISHAHQDHLDFRSLRRIGRSTRMVAPRGTGSILRRHGFRQVDEVDVGQAVRIGTLDVRAIPADHPTQRMPFGGESLSVGYAIEGEQRIAFLGDTDLFDEMDHLVPGLDVALVPVWGWGPSIGTGHLDPERAAQAMQMLQPRIAIPIHWGTLAPITFRSPPPEHLAWPGPEFARQIARLAPEVEARVLAPGEATQVSAHPRSGGCVPH
jgi:L-ascorbate metabolism protein UlaG (beta-lactamase superfamily)